MQENIKKAILNALIRATAILKVREEKDVLELAQLSDALIEHASIYQEEDSISVAVLIYAMYKLIERPAGLGNAQYKQMYTMLNDAQRWLDKGNVQNYHKAIQRCILLVNTIEKRFKVYIEEVVTKARITKGSKLYEQGLSAGRAAELLGISQWELMNYIGKTLIYEQEKFTDDVKERLMFTRRLFR